MFDYDAAAELFSRRSGLSTRNKIRYQRFAHAADAILFAIERLPFSLLDGAFLEVNDERFGAAEIRSLYDDTNFPLQKGRS